MSNSTAFSWQFHQRWVIFRRRWPERP